jgi:hypothetical protein
MEADQSVGGMSRAAVVTVLILSVIVVALVAYLLWLALY